jgi:DNA modification methylase
LWWGIAIGRCISGLFDEVKVMYQLYPGDCLEVMKGLEPQSIDAIICDPPYGTTACAWDSVIPFAPMWECIKRVIKPKGTVVLFGNQPYTSALVMSNPDWYRSTWIWRKPMGTNYLNANREPLKNHEDITVFSQGYGTYNPQMRSGGKAYITTRGNVGDFIQDKAVGGYITINGGERYPLTVVNFNQQKGLHGTQKPVDLMSYLVKTYTNPCETVLDFTCGSGSTGVACAETGRRFVGIELDPHYFAVASERIEAAYRKAQGLPRLGKASDLEGLPLFG